MDDIAAEIRAILVEAQRGTGTMPVAASADAIDQIVRSLGIELIFRAYLKGTFGNSGLRELDYDQLCEAFAFVKTCSQMLDRSDGKAVPIGRAFKPRST